jgi:hypothetical protein
VENVARIGKMGNAYKIIRRKPKRKRPLGIILFRSEDNIKTDYREM